MQGTIAGGEQLTNSSTIRSQVAGSLDARRGPKCAPNQLLHLQPMVKFQHLRLWSLIPHGVDDLLFEWREFRVANHAAANDLRVD